MKEESQNPRIDPELEARIVALVLGEASDFERDRLNRLIEDRSELAKLREQIQNVHGLLTDVATGESISEDDDWKLSAEKRNTVLAFIGGDAAEQSTNQAVNKSTGNRNSTKRNLFWSLTKVAAVFGGVAVFGLVAMLAFLNNRANNFVLASNAARNLEVAAESLSDDTATSSGGFLIRGGVEGIPAKKKEPPSERLDHEQNSKSLLSAIRDSLSADGTLPAPYYMLDDVQHLPEDADRLPPKDAAAPVVSSGKNAEPKQQSADNAALFDTHEPAWSAELDEDGDRVVDSRPNAPADGNGELSFPAFGDFSGGLDASEAAAPTSTLSVPDQGTVLLGGVNRVIEEREFGVSGESTVSSPTTSDYIEPKIDGESFDSFDIANKSKSILGSNGRPGSRRGSEDARSATIDGIQNSSGGNQKVVPETEFIQGSHALDREQLEAAVQPFSFFEASRSAGNSVHEQIPLSITFSSNAEDSKTAFDDFNGVAAETEGLGGGGLGGGGGGFGGGGSQTIDESKKYGAVEHQRGKRESLGMESGFGNIDAAGNSQSEHRIDEFGELPEAKESEEYFERKDFDADNATHFHSGLKKTPRASGESRGEPEGQIANKKNQWGYDLGATNGDSDRGDNKEYQYWSIQSKDGGELQPLRGQLAIDGKNRWDGYVPPRSGGNSRFKESTVKKSAASAGLNEKSAQDEAFSTFSLHISDVAFKLARAALSNGEWPEAAKIRIEEFVNAFDYGDPMPNQSEKVACCLEQSIHPFLQQRNLLRVSIRTAAAGRSSNTPLRLTFVLDNSGSMERTDRQQTVRRAFSLLAQQLKPTDQVTLISFARQPRLLADKVGGAQSRELVQLIRNMPSEGGTNIEAALQLAFEKAQEQQVNNAQNRIILLTDGAVNLGDANPESLSRMITTMRNAGIAFDAAGIGAEGLNDEILEALTRKGDGRYYLLESPNDADDGFARQIAGALRPSAKNVKVQIEFNPKRVGRYKLLGFEKHRLKQEDFRNDKVDAAEMTASEAGVAMYQFEAQPEGEGDIGYVSVRFRDLETGRMIENCWPIPYQAAAPRADQAGPSLRIATAATFLAAKLRGEPLGQSVDLKTLSDLIAGLPVRYRNHKRVQQLQLMIHQARQISGK